ncbi:MAG: FkbM family methyltransferase [Chloroflexota bacterium]
MNKYFLQFAAFLARILPAPVRRAFYIFAPLARLIRVALNRAAPTGLTEVTVAAGELAGARLRLDLQLEKDYWLGTYETDLQAAVREFAQPGWVAYDVGANIGYITLLLARAVDEGGQVFSFEALPANLERLRVNVGLNGLGHRVEIIPGAVAAASAPVRFLVGPSGAMGKAEGSAGRQGGHIESLEVPGIALDDFIYRDGNPPPQVIKMDIEGGEVLALRGMPRVLREARPLILLELHGPEAARVAWETLTGAGYSLHRMERGYPSVPSLTDLDWKAYVVASHKLKSSGDSEICLV